MRHFFVRSGANDPSFNLRREPAMIIRKKGKNALFVNVLEIHGQFNGTAETSTESEPTVSNIQIVKTNELYTAVKIRFPKKTITLVLCNNTADPALKHELQVGDQNLIWTGPIYIN